MNSFFNKVKLVHNLGGYDFNVADGRYKSIFSNVSANKCFKPGCRNGIATIEHMHMETVSAKALTLAGVTEFGELSWSPP